MSESGSRPRHRSGRPRRFFADLPKAIDHVLVTGPGPYYARLADLDRERALPTRRRVYVRHPDGSPVRDSVSVAVDVTDVTFS